VKALLHIWRGLQDLWCGYTHGGGHVLRDSSGRINWQCAKCGRWDTPVSPEDEASFVRAAAQIGAAATGGSE
jgi:hypothetical protein